MDAPTQGRCQTRSNLQRGVFGSQRLPRTNRQRSGDEFADRRAQRNIPVVNIERGLGLIHSTPPDPGKNVDYQQRNNESNDCR